jgi:hypothetical protein
MAANITSRAKIPDRDFIDLFERIGPAEMARQLDMNLRGIYTRRESLEKKIGRQITGPLPANGGRLTRHKVEHQMRLHHDIDDGIVVIGSDAHFWPGIITTAHRALVKFCKEYRPEVVVMNGDVLDGASISRHAPIGWEKRPSLIEEIEACKDRLGEITVAADKARRVWTLGNHDARFETRLATMAPEYARVYGLHLKDHFPDWEPTMSLWVNEQLVIKHRIKGGIHATHNNTVNAGKSTATGHLHSGKVTPFTDYNGTRWGIDTGTLAEPNGPQFEYAEDNPMNHRSGFAVTTWRQGQLLPPEMVYVVGDGEVAFRGKVYPV